MDKKLFGVVASGKPFSSLGYMWGAYSGNRVAGGTITISVPSVVLGEYLVAIFINNGAAPSLSGLGSAWTKKFQAVLDVGGGNYRYLSVFTAIASDVSVKSITAIGVGSVYLNCMGFKYTGATPFLEQINHSETTSSPSIISIGALGRSGHVVVTSFWFYRLSASSTVYTATARVAGVTKNIVSGWSGFSISGSELAEGPRLATFTSPLKISSGTVVDQITQTNNVGVGFEHNISLAFNVTQG